MNNKDSLDKLLKEKLLAPPENFSNIVVDRIVQETPYDFPQQLTRRQSNQTFWPLVALACSSIVGTLQIMGFIFSLWIPAAAG